MKILNSIFGMAKAAPAAAAPAPALTVREAEARREDISNGVPGAVEPPRPAPAVQHARVPLDPQLIPSVVTLGHVEKVPAVRDFIRDCRDACPSYDRVNAEAMKLTRGAHEEYAEHLADIAATVGRGEPVPADGWTLQDIKQDREIKRKALCAEARRISQSLAGGLIPVADAIGEAAGKLADDLEAKIRAAEAPFNQPFFPSRLLQQLRYLQQHPREQIPPPGTTAPRALLAWCGITID